MAFNRGANVAAKLVIVPGDWTPPTPPEYEYDTTAAVNAIADDCSMTYGGDDFSIVAQSLMVGASGGSRNSGIIFRNIQVPAGATVLSARMILTAFENSYSEGCNMFIAAETVSNPSNFITYEDFWSRTVTETGLGYTGLPSIEQDSQMQVLGMAPLIQQVINLGTWELGKAISLRILDYGSTDGATRSFYTAGNPSDSVPWGKVPKLNIVWEL
jgi:hypothetical protein